MGQDTKTGADGGLHAVEISTQSSDSKGGWQAPEAQLAEWLLDPASAVDPDAVAPSKASLRVARTLVAAWRLNREDAPTAVVPDGNGGILFEWQVGTDGRSIEIDMGGCAEEILIRNGRRIFRKPIPIA